MVILVLGNRLCHDQVKILIPLLHLSNLREKKRRDDDFAGDECLKCAESFALPVLQRALAASLILTQILSILTTTETLPNAQLTQTLRTQFDSF